MEFDAGEQRAPQCLYLRLCAISRGYPGQAPEDSTHGMGGGETRTRGAADPKRRHPARSQFTCAAEAEGDESWLIVLRRVQRFAATTLQFRGKRRVPL